MKGHIILRYIDNLFLLGKAYNLCVTNVMDTFTQCDSLGFSIYPDKSVNTFPKTSFVRIHYWLPYYVYHTHP